MLQKIALAVASVGVATLTACGSSGPDIANESEPTGEPASMSPSVSADSPTDTPAQAVKITECNSDTGKSPQTNLTVQNDTSIPRAYYIVITGADKNGKTTDSRIAKISKVAPNASAQATAFATDDEASVVTCAIVRSVTISSSAADDLADWWSVAPGN